MSIDNGNLHSFPELESLQVDEYSAADAARQRLAPKSRFGLLSSISDLRKNRKSSAKSTDTRSERDSDEVSTANDEVAQLRPSTGTDNTLIDLDGSAITEFHENRDVYRWAMIYENQRGLTLFSTPYYSSLSLLPHDPLPFTIPSTSSKRSHQPEVSLTEYPLPDGTWRWVSKSWMIDMRTDSGEVQHDGFEYNWRFRQDKWKANVGNLSAGGWVRRRRWVRLMMRPARIVSEGPHETSNGVGSYRTSKSISSNMPLPSEISMDAVNLDAKEVWKGDDTEQDWSRCHVLLRRLGRDGRKLELWKMWLGGYYSEHSHLGHMLGDAKEVKKQWTEDEQPLPSEALKANQDRRIITEGASPALESIAAVLRLHGDAILRSFIYPDSRAQFLELLGFTGLLPEMNVGLGIGWSTTDIDFWSYASGLDKRVEEDDAELERKEKEAERREMEEVDAYAEVEGHAEVPAHGKDQETVEEISKM